MSTQNGTKVYVGNLSWSTTDESLEHTFQSYGAITDKIVMRDRDTGRSRGFGFVTFGTAEEANNAITGLNEQELDGRRIKVNLANARPSGGGGGGNYGAGGNAGGYSGGYSGGGYPSGGYSGGGYSGGGGGGGGYGSGGYQSGGYGSNAGYGGGGSGEYVGGGGGGQY